MEGCYHGLTEILHFQKLCIMDLAGAPGEVGLWSIIIEHTLGSWKAAGSMKCLVRISSTVDLTYFSLSKVFGNV